MTMPITLFRGAQPGADPEVDLRVFTADPDEGDLGPMYVLDVLGVSILVRDRGDGLYVHLDTTDAATGRLRPDLPLVVEVNNGGENYYGGST